MSSFENLGQLLAVGAEQASALESADRSPLLYGELRRQVQRTVTALKAMGLEKHDRVAIVLPNGALMASVFLGVASGTTAAPLNPGYRSDEFQFYLQDLNAKAVVVESGSTSSVIDVARTLGIKVLSVVPSSEVTGLFDLQNQGQGSPDSTLQQQEEEVSASDIALILHTSGTTSRPKIVPLTQANICLSATNVAATLRLTPTDRGLHVMPMFHIHGLIAGLLAPLAVGSTVYCTPGFNALKFFAWMNDARPSWYTAVPTMHQAILARAGGNLDVIAAHPLRFIRSSSSSIPPQVIAELERVFAAPLIESYGMTEAAHQMASNPLPPQARKPGTVGVAAGPQIAIMDEQGNILASDQIGEIVIRGANVTAGYENNPKANAEAFTNGWFRTGDQGCMDAEGYLSITGRLKEIISRGGEKISPREIDEILMDHPAIEQVITFGIPHQMLGEEVGAAVVLRPNTQVTERELRDFVATRVADFKVPRKILFMEEIPKGATGKLQRIGLAKKLGLAD